MEVILSSRYRIIRNFAIINKVFSMNLQTSEAVDLLCRLIEIPRYSREETAAADFLYHHMTSVCGLPTERDGNNLWSVTPLFNSSLPTLLLCAHIDTVRPVAGWTSDPHQALRSGDRIQGLGSNDDGASLVSLLQAFRSLRTCQLPWNLVFLASAEEEVSGKNGVEHVLPLLPHIDVALVGEPTGMQPAVAERGLMVLDVTAHGIAGHAARTGGDNAIYHAMDDMQWFRTHRWERHSELLGDVKMTVTMVQAGTQHNVIPDTCTFCVDVRTNECYSNRELYEEICKHVQSDVHARSFRLSSSHISTDHPLVQRAVALGGKPFGSPTLSDQALMPFPSLKMGPGDSTRSHTADEFVLVSEIDHAIQHYIQLLS